MEVFMLFVVGHRLAFVIKVVLLGHIWAAPAYVAQRCRQDHRTRKTLCPTPAASALWAGLIGQHSVRVEIRRLAILGAWRLVGMAMLLMSITSTSLLCPAYGYTVY
jgi:hypothetical protein